MATDQWPWSSSSIPEYEAQTPPHPRGEGERSPNRCCCLEQATPAEGARGPEAPRAAPPQAREGPRTGDPTPPRKGAPPETPTPTQGGGKDNKLETKKPRVHHCQHYYKSPITHITLLHPPTTGRAHWRDVCATCSSLGLGGNVANQKTKNDATIKY